MPSAFPCALEKSREDHKVLFRGTIQFFAILRGISERRFFAVMLFGIPVRQEHLAR